MARTGAIVIRWNAVAKGREQIALDAFGEALGYFEELAKEGRIIAHREYFASGGGDGMMIIEGLLPELHRLAQDDDYLRHLMKGAAVVDRLQAEIYTGGSDQTVQEMLAMSTAVEEELGLR